MSGSAPCAMRFLKVRGVSSLVDNGRPGKVCRLYGLSNCSWSSWEKLFVNGNYVSCFYWLNFFTRRSWSSKKYFDVIFITVSKKIWLSIFLLYILRHKKSLSINIWNDILKIMVCEFKNRRFVFIGSLISHDLDKVFFWVVEKQRPLQGSRGHQ